MGCNAVRRVMSLTARPVFGKERPWRTEMGPRADTSPWNPIAYCIRLGSPKLLTSGPKLMHIRVGIVLICGLLIPALVFLPADRALAVDDCSAILNPALLNKTTNQSSTSSAEATRNWLCAASLSEANNYNSSSVSGSGGGKLDVFGLFGIGGQGAGSTSTTEGQFQAWKQQNCVQNDYSKNKSAFEYYAQQALAPAAIEAWRECKLRQQSLNCWISPHGNDTQIEFHYNWNSREIDLPVIQDFNVTRGASVPQPLRQRGEKVFIGESTALVSRVPTQDTFINLNIVRSQRFADSCTAYVPRVPVLITTAQLRGRWCTTDRDWGKGWEGVVWEDWVDSGPSQLQIAHAQCQDQNRLIRGRMITCGEFAQAMISRPTSFRAVSASEFEVLFPDAHRNRERWERFRMVSSNQLKEIGSWGTSFRKGVNFPEPEYTPFEGEYLYRCR